MDMVQCWFSELQCFVTWTFLWWIIFCRSPLVRWAESTTLCSSWTTVGWTWLPWQQSASVRNGSAKGGSPHFQRPGRAWCWWPWTTSSTGTTWLQPAFVLGQPALFCGPTPAQQIRQRESPQFMFSWAWGVSGRWENVWAPGWPHRGPH